MKKQTNRLGGNRLLALLLTAALVVGAFPAAVFADNTPPAQVFDLTEEEATQPPETDTEPEAPAVDGEGDDEENKAPTDTPEAELTAAAEGEIVPFASDPALSVFDVSEGDILIEAGTTPGTLKVSYGAGQVEDNIPNTQTITLIGTLSGHTGGNPVVIDASCDIELRDLDIEADESPINIENGPHIVNFTLTGNNRLVAQDNHGLAIASGHMVSIAGSGSLTVDGSEFGIDIGNDTQLEITGDVQVTAKGNDGPGIGTGAEPDDCTLTVSGNAVVYAEGNIGSAGIGAWDGRAGFAVMLKDNAQVHAQGDPHGFGSGDGATDGGTVTILGNAQVWGTGNATFKDGGGNTLQLLAVGVVTNDGFTMLADVPVANGSHTSTTDDEGVAYLYTREGAAGTLAVAPGSSYRFKQWVALEGYTIPPGDETNTTLSFTMPTNTVKIVALFDPASTLNGGEGDRHDGIDFETLVGGGIYYGTYKHATHLANNTNGLPDRWDDGAAGETTNYTQAVATPILWQVMGEDPDTGKAVALSEYVLDTQAFDATGNAYEGSDIKNWLENHFAAASHFPGTEAGFALDTAVKTRLYNQQYGTPIEKTTPWGGSKYDVDGIAIDPSPTPQQFYLPWGTAYHWDWVDGNESKVGWCADADKGSGRLLTVHGTTLKNKNSASYWLRSPASIEEDAALSPTINGVGRTKVTYAMGVRPAFQFELSSVLFASQVVDNATGRVWATQADNINYEAGEHYKLTLVNPALDVTSLETTANLLSGGGELLTVTAGKTLELTGTIANADKLVYKIVEDTGTERRVVGYGTDNSGTALTVNGTANITGGNLTAGGDYTLYVWAQKDNATYSHEGSEPVWFTLDVEPAPIAPPNKGSNDGGNNDSWAPPPRAEYIVDKAEMQKLIATATEKGTAVRASHHLPTTVKAEAWAVLNGEQFVARTTVENEVQVQITLPNTAALEADMRLSGYVKGDKVNSYRAMFEKWFVNDLCIVHLDHAGSFGQRVEVAALVDLAGMDEKSLLFYRYDSETHTYKGIENPQYQVDKNGYLHFSTEQGGTIVVSDGVLNNR